MTDDRLEVQIDDVLVKFGLLRLIPGDTIVVMPDFPLDAESQAIVQDRLARQYPDQKTLVLDPTVAIGVIREKAG